MTILTVFVVQYNHITYISNILTYIEDLAECSCFIEVIKRVGEKR